MKNEIGCKSAKDDSKKAKPGLPTPQLNLDPEKKRDIFNRFLLKYSTKSTKINNPPTTAVNSQRSAKFPSVLPTKSPNKMKDKLIKKKKSNSDKNIIKSGGADDYGAMESEEAWKNSVKNYNFDLSLYKNHMRIRNRFPYPLPFIKEADESEIYQNSESDESKSEDLYESVNHSFTLLPCGDQKHGSKEETGMFYEEKVVKGKNPLVEEVQARHITKTPSGTLIWVGNDVLHNLIHKKHKKQGDNAGEVDAKQSRDFRGSLEEEASWIGEGEERSSTKSGKTKKNKTKKASQESDDKSNKTGSHESKPSRPSSSLPHLGQEDGKLVKKIAEKMKKPKKLIKKQAFTLVTSKPSA